MTNSDGDTRSAPVYGRDHFALIGALSATTLHDLATPLSTIMLIAEDSLAALNRDTQAYRDMRDILIEVERCRDLMETFRRLSQPPVDADDAGNADDIGAAIPTAHTTQTLNTWLDDILHSRQRGEITVNLMWQSVAYPAVVDRFDLRFAVSTIFDNALRHARDEITVDIRWSDSKIVIEFQDDGPGFDPPVLHRQDSDFPHSTPRKAGSKGGLGLGIFIARHLLNAAGGALKLQNSDTDGAIVIIEFPQTGVY